MKFIDEIDTREKRLLLRADLNVPLSPEGRVTDSSRIHALIPTLRYALEKRARLTLCSHLGRPKGKVDRRYSIMPVGEELTELLDEEIIVADDCVGMVANQLVSSLKPGKVILLENLRFHKGEEANDPYFAEQLAKGQEVYINDAFGAVHRAHASVVKVAGLIPDRGAGLLIKKELDFLGRLLSSPEPPFVALLGGAKVSDKISVIHNLMDRVDQLLIGGAMAYTFLKAMGVESGDSLLDEEGIDSARKILNNAERKGVSIVLPVDHVVEPSDAAGEVDNTKDEQIPVGTRGMDIGPKTIELFGDILNEARTIFWNGPLGRFEQAPFEHGSVRISGIIAGTDALKIGGGGDTLAAIKMSGKGDKFDHLSTGGGASLKFLEGKSLPGLKALEG